MFVQFTVDELGTVLAAAVAAGAALGILVAALSALVWAADQ